MSSVEDARSTAIHRVFEPARESQDEICLPVVGAIPQGLRGTLYRNGPARWEAGGFRAGHPFDGDGLVSRFVIDDGVVRFRSRYVRTPKFLAEESGRGARVRGLYTQAAGTAANVGRMPADTANTHAVPHANRLLALSDAGRPWELDLNDLSTVGPCDFDGRLPRWSRFSPHPKIDPVTGELFNFGMDLALGPKIPAGLRCYRVDPSGRLHQAGLVRLDNLVVQHDFAITERYLVFALAPITIDPVRAGLAMLGRGALGDAADYRPEQGMRIVLVPRDGGAHRVIECEPFVYVHVDNAYDDGRDVVLDVVRYDSFDFLTSTLKDFRNGLPEMGRPARVRITMAGRVELNDIEGLDALEFPMHDERRTGRAHRYSYYASYHPDRDGAIVKYDHRTGFERRHVFSHGEFAGEPVFVPRTAKSEEDDGWILAVTYLSAEHRTALVILDARAIEQRPLAVAHLDRHFFPGFHGSFTTRVCPSTM
ncbi:carotenoid oxygenase family protein [Nocardia sp. CDC159]|uniref:Dioxygenase n=1 Tax=Nocardia pulmonis TaxID=2951408 RepID=A0A9X2EGR9_9NOCA|nr:MULTISPECIES: carotenoid oxygenase family protein [Nocardia]MCM6778458.1 carotenoid oxygenase family protein [Nocardia pulmonis]MCM6791347.1 carotenoid oxygenase family protein [Nocardia sp. CDC159]